MIKQASRLLISQWPGLASGRSPHLEAPAALAAENVSLVVPGELSPRKGMLLGSFANATTNTTADTIAMYAFDKPEATFTIYEDSAGAVRAGRAFTTTVADYATHAAPTIATSINVNQPLCFAKSRFNELIMVNGVDRGRRWDGLTAAVELLGITAPSAAPGISVSSGGSLSAGEYTCAYRYIDDTLPNPVCSAMSDFTTVTVSANDKLSWTVTLPTEVRVSGIQLWRTTAGQSTTLYYITTLSIVTSSYASDTTQDSTLRANAVADPDESTQIKVLNEAGLPNARRQGVPPSHKPYVAFFQDRAFYAGSVRYTEGTVSTNGSTTITGSGTAWVSTMAGRYISIVGEVRPYLIVTASATSITVDTAVANTASGLSYAVFPSNEERNQIYYSEVDEPESVHATSTIIVQENTGDDDEITGLMPYGSYLYVLKNRHIYRLGFFAQPKIDVSITLASHRGCVNNRCWTRYEEAAYLMDQAGIYQFNSGGAKSISEPIQDLFRDGTIDWSLSKWFFAHTDLVNGVVRFFVKYTTDTGTRPKRWLEYNVRSSQWTTGSGLMELGGTCFYDLSGRTRVLVGGENDCIYLFAEGSCDHVSSATRGTVTSATGTTLTDSGAAFAASVVESTVAIVAGTGKGQIRRITARTSTQLTVATWDTIPDTTSVYLVGAIQWNYRTGLFRVPEDVGQVDLALALTYKPTTNDNSLDIRRYVNHSTTAANNEAATDFGEAITTTKDDPNAVLDLKASRSSLGTAAGFDRFKFPGRAEGEGQGARFIGLEMRGFQGTEALKVYEALIEGLGS